MGQKAIIFDLNGVFIQSKQLSDRIRDDYGVPTEEFLPILSHAMAITRKPEAPDVYSLFQPHLQKWKILMNREQFLAYWFDAEHENDAMVSLAAELKRDGYKIFVLSNNFRERTEHYAQHFPFLRELDRIYYSWQTGNVKPGEQCFEQILEENEIDPNDCYYFDDSEKNVAAARELGIWAYRFEGPEQVKQKLRSRP
jgi:HAD superfamily hydrolase (TIGR01509 family)